MFMIFLIVFLTQMYSLLFCKNFLFFSKCKDKMFVFYSFVTQLLALQC